MKKLLVSFIVLMCLGFSAQAMKRQKRNHTVEWIYIDGKKYPFIRAQFEVRIENKNDPYYWIDTIVLPSRDDSYYSSSSQEVTPPSSKRQKRFDEKGKQRIRW